MWTANSWQINEIMSKNISLIDFDLNNSDITTQLNWICY